MDGPGDVIRNEEERRWLEERGFLDPPETVRSEWPFEVGNLLQNGVIDIAETKFYLYRDKGRRFLQAYFTDPVSGNHKTRSTKCTNRSEAWQFVAGWKQEVESGVDYNKLEISWRDLRRRYEREKLAGLAVESQALYSSSLNHLERIANPSKLKAIDSRQMATLRDGLRKLGLRPATVTTHVRGVLICLRWAHEQEYVAKVPKVDLGKQTGRRAGSRPIIGEEFERMLAVTPKVRGKDWQLSQRYLTGLWLSGLRLGESLILCWDQDEPFCVDLSGKYPRLRIYGEAQKNCQDQLLPITPDFVRHLLETQVEDRHGVVYSLPTASGATGSVVSDIGKRANVLTDRDKGKHATAHDFRRSFGTRWARKVKPFVLMQLMRHSDVGTTQSYYVSIDADDVAGDVWAIEERRKPAVELFEYAN